MTLGERIKTARQRAGLSQKDLADRLGVTMRSVGSWERGENVPRNLAQLEAILGPLIPGAAAGEDVDRVVAPGFVGMRRVRTADGQKYVTQVNRGDGRGWVLANPLGGARDTTPRMSESARLDVLLSARAKVANGDDLTSDERAALIASFENDELSTLEDRLGALHRQSLLLVSKYVDELIHQEAQDLMQMYPSDEEDHHDEAPEPEQDEGSPTGSGAGGEAGRGGAAIATIQPRPRRPAPKPSTDLPKAADTPRKGRKGEAFDPETGGYVGGEE